MGATLYMPTAFDYSDDRALFDQIIGAGRFVQILSADHGEISISYAPMEYHCVDNTVHFHLAADNPHARSLNEGDVATALWQGPDAYVSPSWYMHNGVPTWNYAIAQCSGRVTFVLDDDRKHDHLRRLTALFDRPTGSSWEMSSLGQERLERALNRINVYEMTIEIRALKLKLSQNKDHGERAAVARHLAESPGNEEILKLMNRVSTEQR